MPDARRTFGNEGEDKASLFLERAGYQILERNFKCKIGEIDIIASKENILSFVEVKTRNSLKYGLPCEAVTISKQSKIKRSALYYLMIHPYLRSLNPQFDIIEILLINNECYVRHLKEAF